MRLAGEGASGSSVWERSSSNKSAGVGNVSDRLPGMLQSAQHTYRSSYEPTHTREQGRRAATCLSSTSAGGGGGATKPELTIEVTDVDSQILEELADARELSGIMSLINLAR